MTRGEVRLATTCKTPFLAYNANVTRFVIGMLISNLRQPVQARSASLVGDFGVGGTTNTAPISLSCRNITHTKRDAYRYDY